MARRRLTTARQKREIEKAIRDHHLAFAAEILGPEAISEEDYARLSASGKIRKSVLPKNADAATASVVLGKLSIEGDPEAVASMSPDNFWRSHLPASRLSEAEKEAAEIVRDNAGALVRSLGDRIDAKTRQVLLEADSKLRKTLTTSMRREVARGIIEHRSAEEVSKKLASIAKDASRDWLRVAATELHNAVEEGKATAIIKSLPEGSDPLVFKRPFGDACPYCKLLYLKSDGVTPRVFRMSDLASNGTNHLRKARRPTLRGENATEWLPVIGAMHPWCKCQLHAMPDGFVFDKKGKLSFVGVRKSDQLLEIESVNSELLRHRCDHG